MATFEAQVEGLTSLAIDGSSAPTQTELTQFLTDGAKEVINLLPEGLLPLCTTSVSFTSGSASTLNTGKVLHVLRSDGDISQPCRNIPAMYKGKYSDPDDMNYATVTDPAFYVENNTIDVLPAGGSCTYSEVQYPSVAYGDSLIGATSLTGVTATAVDPTVFTKSSHGLSTGDIVKLSNFTEMIEINGMTGTVTKLDANTFEVDGVSADPAETTGGNVVKSGGFPDEAEYLVPIYASIKALQNAMGNKTSDLPSDISFPSIPVTPASPSFDTGAISVSSSAPTYTKTSLVLRVAPTISDLNISSVLPVPVEAPSYDSGAISVSSSVPTYTKPTLVLGVAPSISDLNIKSIQPIPIEAPSFSAPEVSAITVGTMPTVSNIGVPPTYAKPTITARVSFNTFFEGGSLNPFDDSNPGVFSISSVAPAPPSAPSFTTPDVSSTTLSNLGVPPTYTSPSVTGNAGLTGMEAGVIADGTDQIEFDTWWDTLGDMIETNEDIELASSQLQKINSYINAFQAETQDALNVFNDANAEYQGRLQEAIQQAQINAQEAQQEANLKLQKENQEYSAKLQKFAAEVNKYQAEIGDEVQQYSKKLERYQLEVSNVYKAWEKTESDSLQQYQIDIQNELNEFNKENANYQVKLQEAIQQSQIDKEKVTQQAQLDSQDAQQEANLKLQKEYQEYQSKLNKYSNEVQSYQAQINKEIQEYQKNLDGDLKVWEFGRQSDIQKYSSDIQNELNEFNKEQVVFQNELQEKIQEAQNQQTKDSAEYGAKLQRYGSEIQSYQTQINKEVQAYQQNLEGDLRVWQAERQTDIQKYSGDIQDELNEFNKEQTVFQNELQEKIQEATNQQTKDSSEYAAKLQKYSAEAQLYSAEVNEKIQDFSTKLQKHSTDYQWLQSQYAQLKSDYSVGLQILGGGGVAPPQQ